MLLSALAFTALLTPASPGALLALSSDAETSECFGGGGSLEPCVSDDMRALDDLRRVAAQVKGDLEQLRERTFDDPVSVEFADREWLDQAVRERWDEERSPERVAFEELSAKMLGMLPIGASLREEELRLLEQSDSFFDRRSDQLFVLEAEGQVSPLVLAAGLSEALNDQHFKHGWLGSPDEGTDRRWVREAVQKGSNVALLLLWAFENLEHVAIPELSKAQSRVAHSSLADSPPYVWKPMLGLPARGESFLRRSTRASWISPPRLSDLDQVVDEQPLSTEQILHPDKYWTVRRRDVPRDLSFDVSRLPSGWTLAHQDTLGELILSVLTQPFDARHGVDPSLFSLSTMEISDDPTSGWDGDRVALLQGDEGTIVHLVTAWDTPEDGEEFRAAVDAQRSDMLDNLNQLAGVAASRGVRVAAGLAGQITVTAWMGPEEDLVDRVLAGMRVGV